MRLLAVQDIGTEVMLESSCAPGPTIRAWLEQLGPQVVQVRMPSGRIAAFKLKNGKPAPSNVLFRHLQISPLSLEKLRVRSTLAGL